MEDLCIFAGGFGAYVTLIALQDLLILHGEEDAYIRMEDIRHLRRINERSKLVIVPGTSHRFLEDGAWDMVLDLTRDWFEFEQVLCCDWE